MPPPGEQLAPIPLVRWALDDRVRPIHLHASAVAFESRAILLCGPSGSGKSDLSLTLIGLGARLVCDDICTVHACDSPGCDRLTVAAPAGAIPAVEARGIGLLHAGPTAPSAHILAVVDLATPETRRLPPRRQVAMDNRRAPLILGAGRPNLAFALAHLLRHGWYTAP